MSRATPMDHSRRAEVYAGQSGLVPTPRQIRQLARMQNRAQSRTTGELPPHGLPGRPRSRHPR